MSFSRPLVVRFHETDPAGIVFFSRVFEYCHAVYEELLTEVVGGDFERFFRTSPWGTPLVHAEADYHRPLRLGERLTATVVVERVGRTSVSYRYALADGDGQLRATVRLVHSCIDRATFTAVPVPAELLAGLRRAGALEEAG